MRREPNVRILINVELNEQNEITRASAREIEIFHFSSPVDEELLYEMAQTKIASMVESDHEAFIPAVLENRKFSEVEVFGNLRELNVDFEFDLVGYYYE